MNGPGNWTPRAPSIKPAMEKRGFDAVYHLAEGQKYEGNADVVFLVSDTSRIGLAEVVRVAEFSGRKVDVVVCKNAGSLETQIQLERPKTQVVIIDNPPEEKLAKAA